MRVFTARFPFVNELFTVFQTNTSSLMGYKFKSSANSKQSSFKRETGKAVKTRTYISSAEAYNSYIAVWQISKLLVIAYEKMFIAIN